MGDAAFGMTGLDFETAVRCDIPVLTVVLNNSTMAIEKSHMAKSHHLYGTRDIGGNYSDMAAAMDGWSERVEDPSEIAPAIRRARSATEDGRAALLEFITSEETDFLPQEAVFLTMPEAPSHDPSGWTWLCATPILSPLGIGLEQKTVQMTYPSWEPTIAVGL